MTLADVDEVLAIEIEVQAYPWTRGNFIDALNQGYLCRVNEGEDLRSYAVLRPVAGEAELLSIGVSAAHQRRGLGRAMLQEMLDMARQQDIRRVFLEVRASNAAAIALYRSSGFVEIGVRRGYYRNVYGSEDATTMACELKLDPAVPETEERLGERSNG